MILQPYPGNNECWVKMQEEVREADGRQRSNVGIYTDATMET